MQVEGCRRLWALVSQLPPESATHAPDGWGMREELLAAQLEHTDWWARSFALLKGVKPSSLPPRLKIPRPGDEPARPRAQPPSALIAFYAKATSPTPL